MAQVKSGIGTILLLVVLAVVMLLVAKSWKTIAPTALDTQDALQSGPLHDHGQGEAGDAIRKGDLPGLRETQENTDAHAAQVQEALNAVE